MKFITASSLILLSCNSFAEIDMHSGETFTNQSSVSGTKAHAQSLCGIEIQQAGDNESALFSSENSDALSSVDNTPVIKVINNDPSLMTSLSMTATLGGEAAENIDTSKVEGVVHKISDNSSWRSQNVDGGAIIMSEQQYDTHKEAYKLGVNLHGVKDTLDAGQVTARIEMSITCS